MQALYDVPAPAKLNLFLHITGRRADGYHLLQSVFMLLNWCDRLHFEHLSSPEIGRSDVGDPALNPLNPALHLPADDLCVKAARALQAATGCQQGVHIHLDKRLPAQAGLGGGSSDAASTLLALNRLWGLGLSRSELARIGLTLGADVPFFIHGCNAWVEGVGEHIQPLREAAALPDARFVVLKPAAGLETGQIFSHPLLQRDTKPVTIVGFAAYEGGHYQFGRNDLQPVAQTLCPEIEKALAFLQRQGLQGRMTGSGSAVFAKLEEKQSAAFGSVTKGCILQVCENLQMHPLHSWVQD